MRDAGSVSFAAADDCNPKRLQCDVSSTWRLGEPRLGEQHLGEQHRGWTAHIAEATQGWLPFGHRIGDVMVASSPASPTHDTLDRLGSTFAMRLLYSATLVHTVCRDRCGELEATSVLTGRS